MVSERAKAGMSGAEATGVRAHPSGLTPQGSPLRARAPAPPELGQESMMIDVEVDAAMTIALVNRINEVKEGADEQAGVAAAAIVALSDDMDKMELRWVGYSPLCLLEYSAIFAG